MEISIHGRNMQVSDELHELVLSKVAHAVRFLEGGVAVDVELSEAHNPRVADRYHVEITSRTHGHTVRVEGSAADDRTAVDTVVDKFERQLRRLKERLVQRSRSTENKRLNLDAPTTDEEVDEGRKIVRTKRFTTRPMTPEEAALEMEMLGHGFFFFLNAETGQHCVLYNRRDGSLGLIEPE